MSETTTTTEEDYNVMEPEVWEIEWTFDPEEYGMEEVITPEGDTQLLSREMAEVAYRRRHDDAFGEQDCLERECIVCNEREVRSPRLMPDLWG